MWQKAQRKCAKTSAHKHPSVTTCNRVGPVFCLVARVTLTAPAATTLACDKDKALYLARLLALRSQIDKVCRPMQVPMAGTCWSSQPSRLDQAHAFLLLWLKKGTRTSVTLTHRLSHIHLRVASLNEPSAETGAGRSRFFLLWHPEPVRASKLLKTQTTFMLATYCIYKKHLVSKAQTKPPTFRLKQLATFFSIIRTRLTDYALPQAQRRAPDNSR